MRSGHVYQTYRPCLSRLSATTSIPVPNASKAKSAATNGRPPKNSITAATRNRIALTVTSRITLSSAAAISGNVSPQRLNDVLPLSVLGRESVSFTIGPNV
jgi:hypothetical protein